MNEEEVGVSDTRFVVIGKCQENYWVQLSVNLQKQDLVDLITDQFRKYKYGLEISVDDCLGKEFSVGVLWEIVYKDKIKVILCSDRI